MAFASSFAALGDGYDGVGPLAAAPTPTRIVRPLVVGCRLLHDTHVLWHFRGILFCSFCGSHATTAPRRLVDPCRLVASALGKRVVRAIMEGNLPTDVDKWPDALPNDRLLQLE